MPNSGFIKFNTKDITTVIHEETANMDGYAKEADILKACDDAITNEVNVGQVDLATVLSAVAELQTKVQAYETQLANSDYVIESGSNEKGWYRIYKSGWVEQGNRIRSSTTTLILELPIEMADIDYFVGLTPFVESDSDGAANSEVLTLNNSTTSQISVSHYSGIHGLIWEVKGYRKQVTTSNAETVQS